MNMKKKIYEKPTMEIVKLQQQCQLLAGSDLSMIMFEDPTDIIDDPTLIWNF